MDKKTYVNTHTFRDYYLSSLVVIYVWYRGITNSWVPIARMLDQECPIITLVAQLCIDCDIEVVQYFSIAIGCNLIIYVIGLISGKAAKKLLRDGIIVLNLSKFATAVVVLVLKRGKNSFL